MPIRSYWLTTAIALLGIGATVGSGRAEAGAQPQAIRDTVNFAVQPFGSLGAKVVMMGGNRCLPNRVVGMVRFADGVLVTADAAEQQICVFQADGRLIRAMGRAGGGPGEYRSLDAVAPLPGNRIAALDRVQSRVTLLNPATGQVVRTFRIEPPPGTIGRMITAFAGLDDGSLLVGYSDVLRARPSKDPVSFTQHLHRYDTEGKYLGALGKFFESEHFIQTVPPQFGGVAYWDRAFGRVGLVAPVRGGWAYSDGAQPGFTTFRGIPARSNVIVAAIPRRPLTDAQIAQYRTSEMAATKPDKVALQKLLLEGMPFPAVLPFWSALQNGGNGVVVTSLFSPPYSSDSVTIYRWDLTRRTVTPFRVPPRFSLQAAGPNAVCGTVTDAYEEITVLCVTLR